MELLRRPATEADFDFARRVHHEAYRDVVERQFGRFGEEQDQFFARNWAKHPHEIVLSDGVPCGYVAVYDRDEAVVFSELVILPAFQGRGIGTFLLREQMERARGRGVPVWLGVLHENHRAATLYRRLGFRETGRTDTHILMEWWPATAPG
jgi:ribosomal protein S18 acetylase RimI-like enzyme